MCEEAPFRTGRKIEAICVDLSYKSSLAQRSILTNVIHRMAGNSPCVLTDPPLHDCHEAIIINKYIYPCVLRRTATCSVSGRGNPTESSSATCSTALLIARIRVSIASISVLSPGQTHQGRSQYHQNSPRRRCSGFGQQPDEFLTVYQF